MVIGSVILIVAPGYSYEAISVDQGAEITGTSGVDILHENYTISPVFNLLRTNDFSMTSGWRYSQNKYNEEGAILFENGTNGIQLSGSNIDFRMYRYLNILIDDYDTVNFSFIVRPVNGPIRVGIRLVFEEGWNPLTEIEEIITWGDNDGIFNFEVPLDYYKGITQEWIVYVKFEIILQFPEIGIVQIRDARVEALSPELLIPTKLNFKDAENATFFGRLDGRSIFTPYVNITSDSHSEPSYILPSTINETIFLPPGEYAATYGWYISAEYPREGDFILNITPDSEVYVEIRMDIVRLYVDVNLNTQIILDLYYKFPETSYYSYLGSILFLTEFSSYLILPSGMSSFSVTVRINGLSNPRFSSEFEIGLTNHLELTITFPIFLVFGYGLDLVQLLILVIIIGLVVISIISLRHAMSPIPLRALVTNRRTLSLSLLLASYILPWQSSFGFSFTYIGQNPTVRSYTPALGLEYVTHIPGITLVHLIPDISTLLWIIMIFWIPFFFILKQVLFDESLDLNLKTLLPPAIPGILGFIGGIGLMFFGPYNQNAEIGAHLAFLAFVVIVLEVLFLRYKSYKTERLSQTEVDDSE